MQIRKAEPGDKIAIIELLKESLGESTIPKSTALWSWKHEQNPFGPSYVMVAEENGLIVGVRAFMQWQWQWGGNIYRAIRAVDTATHPDHQGKGIFKKLTLEQAAICKAEGIDFIFNTPNQQSMPGYLKMGWVEQGKMPLKLKIVRPFSLAYNFTFNKAKFGHYNGDPSPVQDWNLGEFNFPQSPGQSRNPLLNTVISPAYLQWRFASNPLFRYNYFTDHQNYLLISRIKKQSFKTELRLVEFILLNPDASPRHVSEHVRRQVKAFSSKNEIDIVSLSGRQAELYQRYFGWMGPLPVKPLGPIVTLKNLNMNGNFAALVETGNWGYSLGDLELF